MGLKIHRWKHSGNMPNSSVQSEEIYPPPCQKKKKIIVIILIKVYDNKNIQLLRGESVKRWESTNTKREETF